MRKLSALFLTLGMATTSLAHDDGHGPKLGDQPKYGGAVTAVIDYKQVNDGRKAKLLYKAEITKNESGLVRVYFYDQSMKLLKADQFDSAEGFLLYRGKSKKWESKSFALTKKDGHFEGKLPLKPRPPFNVDVKVKSKDKTLFMAFDNLN